jgi:hypothetical protein
VRSLCIVADVWIRQLVKRSTVTRVLCLVILLLFVLICGIHVAGAHHLGDSDGLALADGVVALAAIGALLLAVAIGGSKRRPPVRPRSSSRRTSSRASPKSGRGPLVVPLRC